MKFLFIIIPVVLGPAYALLSKKWVNKSKRRATKAMQFNNVLLILIAMCDLVIVFSTLGEILGISSDFSSISNFIEIGKTKDLLILDICFTVGIGFIFLNALNIQNGLSDHRKFSIDKKIRSGVFLSMILFILAVITLGVDVAMYCV